MQCKHQSRPAVKFKNSDKLTLSFHSSLFHGEIYIELYLLSNHIIFYKTKNRVSLYLELVHLVLEKKSGLRKKYAKP
jgi:hypothetical protein